MKRILTVLLAVMLLPVISAATADDTLVPVTFCLDWTPNTNHTGVYAAQALGFYEEAGLDVKIVQPPEDGATLMCAAGQAQFSVTAQDSMAAALDRDDPLCVTAVAAVLQHNTSGIISRKGDGITSPKGMEGKVYSTWESPVELAMLRWCMEKDGADFDKVRLIPNNITDEPGALQAHQTDSIWVFYAAKGYRYAAEHPQEAADMLIAGDNTRSLEDSRELVYASQEWISAQYIADAADWGVFDPERWDAFYGWLFENNLTAHDLRGIGYSNDYLPKD